MNDKRCAACGVNVDRVDNFVVCVECQEAFCDSCYIVEAEDNGCSCHLPIPDFSSF